MNNNNNKKPAAQILPFLQGFDDRMDLFHCPINLNDSVTFAFFQDLYIGEEYFYCQFIDVQVTTFVN